MVSHLASHGCGSLVYQAKKKEKPERKLKAIYQLLLKTCHLLYMPYSTFYLDHVVGPPVLGKNLTRSLFDVLKYLDYLITEKHEYFLQKCENS